MPVTITINGENAGHALSELRGLSEGLLSAPAVSDVSSDTLKTATEAGAAEAPAPGKPTRAGRKPKAETAKLPEGPALNISTGDERVDPETVTRTDDVVDLTPYAEPAKAEEAKVYTIDDVRNAATPYIKKHTMAMAQLDLQDCLEAAVGIRQISKLNTADQAQLKKAVETFEAAGKAEARFVKAA